MTVQKKQSIELVPIDLIRVVNPRVRGRKIFKKVIENVADVGLKRPVTVAVRHEVTGIQYDLVCGQGRLEAYRALGQTEIPARVVDAQAQDCLVMGIVENLARQKRSSAKLLHHIQDLRMEGYSDATIAGKIGLPVPYTKGLLALLDAGQTQLVYAVERGSISIATAVELATAGASEIRAMLESGAGKAELRGEALRAARRLLQKADPDAVSELPHGKAADPSVSSARTLRIYKQDRGRQLRFVQRAASASGLLNTVTDGLSKLFSDENFVTLLRAEGLTTMPRLVGDRLKLGGANERS